MRAVVVELTGERGRCSEKTCVAAHDDADVDPRQRSVVQIGPCECLGDELARRAEARAVVRADEVVVDGLGNVDAAELVVHHLGLLIHDAARVGRVVSADIEEMADVVRLHDREHLLAILDVGFVAGRSEGRRRGPGDLLEVRRGGFGEVHEIFVDDAADAVARAVDMCDLGEPARLEDNAYEALVDDCGRTAALRNERVSGELGHFDISIGFES